MLIEETEDYNVGGGTLWLKAEIGNGHLGAIDVIFNDEFIKRAINTPVDEDLGNRRGTLKVVGLVNKNTESNGMLSLRLNDDQDSEVFEYSEAFDDEGVIRFEITIEVS